MHPRLILLRLIVTKPLQSLLEDVSQVIENGVGRTKLIEEENDAFIDDIVEERLIVNYQEKKAYVVYRVFVNSKKDNHQSYINVGWVINEGMPVCNLCRKSLHKDHEKEHCHACGNVFCHACCNHSSIIEGLEDEGPLLVCNLCDYGQVSQYIPSYLYNSLTRLKTENQSIGYYSSSDDEIFQSF